MTGNLRKTRGLTLGEYINRYFTVKYLILNSRQFRYLLLPVNSNTLILYAPKKRV